MNYKLNKNTFSPGCIWKDTEKRLIQAHGGGVLYDRGTYYWYGENKESETYRVDEITEWECWRTDVVGISCYSSTDLINWKNEGMVLKAVSDNPLHDLHISKVAERPKVIYNELTKKYVMWMHIDGQYYNYAAVGIAISDDPTGPFVYLRSFRPNSWDSRDMTIFKDDDGKAYLFYSSEMNKTMHFTRLTDDYLDVVDTYDRIFAGEYREAPIVFRHKDKYYIITSGCTGWDANEAQYAVADSITGPWKVKGNPCIGEDFDKTFNAQATYVFPVNGKKDAYIFMADIWKKENLKESRYIWLPIRFKGDSIYIEWIGNWDISIFE